jgi:uncharacterized protein YbaR (Trm112 family)
MNRDQIIAKTLVDMSRYLNSDENCEPGSADRAVEYDEYDREVFFPEMKRRLPEGEITTCDELRLEVVCCPPCHGFYPHYDMHVVDLSDGRKGWICCAVRGALFPETEIPDDSPEALEFRRIFCGDESSGQGE